MRLTIPEEYRNHFTCKTTGAKSEGDARSSAIERPKVYATRKYEDALLLLNSEEYEQLKKGLEREAQKDPKRAGLARFILASVDAVGINEVEIELPEHLCTRLKGDLRDFIWEEQGILLR